MFFPGDTPSSLFEAFGGGAISTDRITRTTRRATAIIRRPPCEVVIDHTVVYGGADPSGGALSSGRFRSAVSPLYAGGGGGGGGGGGARSGRFQPTDASPEPRSELADGLEVVFLLDGSVRPQPKEVQVECVCV